MELLKFLSRVLDVTNCRFRVCRKFQGIFRTYESVDVKLTLLPSVKNSQSFVE